MITWFLVGFLGLEFASVLMHRYLFHGPLWFLHASHHSPRRGFWEWNDVFSIFFAALSIGLFWVSRADSLHDARFWVASGMTLFGIGYFAVHDVLAHKRAFRKLQAPLWLRHIIISHREHHGVTTRSGRPPYGLLFPDLEKRITSEIEGRRVQSPR